MNHDEVASALVSSRYDLQQVQARLRRFVKPKDPTYRDVIPVHELCGAVKLEDPARVRPVTQMVLRGLNTSRLGDRDPQKPLRTLWLISDHIPHPSGRALLTLAHRDLLTLVQGARVTPALLEDLVEWLEFADLEAKRRVLPALDPSARFIRHGFRSSAEIRGRIWELVAELAGESRAQFEVLARYPAALGLISIGARAIAKKHGTSPVEIGTARWPTDKQLHAYELRPLLESAFRVDPEVFCDVVRPIVDSPHCSEVYERWWMVGFLPWDDEREVLSDTEVGVARVWGRCVFSWHAKLGKAGRFRCKVCKTPAKATAHFEALVTKWCEKMEAESTEPRSGYEKTMPGDGGDNDESTLAYAIEHNERILLERYRGVGGLTPPGPADSGWTPLHKARGDDSDVVRAALELGYAPDAATDDGLTLLDLIASDEAFPWHVASARILVNAGARGSCVGGNSVLHRAAQAGNAELAGLLLESGFDSSARNDDGFSPRELAEQAKQWGVVARLARPGAPGRPPGVGK
ncbi:MAG: ankyrin repeat domain-containing protein [Nannocystales bacterium]